MGWDNIVHIVSHDLNEILQEKHKNFVFFTEFLVLVIDQSRDLTMNTGEYTQINQNNNFYTTILLYSADEYSD